MRAKVTFEVEIPDIDHTTQELTNWLRFEFRDNGHLPAKNPFGEHEPVPVWGTFFVDELPY
jgi:hypothetical protein